MQPSLFDSMHRTRLGPARRTEAHFAYVNESARPEMGPIRDLLEAWYRRYPAVHAADLRHRFRSSDDTAHVSALFELFVHEQLVAGEFRVTCHPPIAGSEKAPDFLANQNGAPEFCVECVLAAEDRRKSGRDRVCDEALDAIDELQSANFFVSVVVHGQPTGSLPIGRTQLVPKLREWLEGLDADAITREYRREGLTVLPSWTWTGAAVRLVFTAMPKKPDRRGRGQRLVGVQADGTSHPMRADKMIDGAVHRKASRYGALDLPYLIAVNVLEFPVDGDHIELALEQSWGTPSAPKNRRVSGLLLATVWNVRSATTRRLQAVLNPSASRPLRAGLLPFPEYDGATLEA